MPRITGDVERVMKISPKPELPSSVVQAGTAKQQLKAATPAAEGLVRGRSAAAASSMAVTLSHTAMEPVGRSTDDFDAVRVKAMRAAIENGTFRVNAEAIADKLLAGAQEMLSPLRSA